MTSYSPPTGRLALVGGRLEPDNGPVFTALHRLCRGRIGIIPVASEVPEEVGEETVDSFTGNGIRAELVPLFWGDRGAAFDPGLVQRVESIGSVFFTGGDQSRIVGSLVQDDEETPLLRAIRRLHAGNGLVAGSSAGAAMMSADMILGGTSNEALSLGTVDDPDIPGLALGTGLGFFPWGVVDQHFIARGRIGRLVVAVRESAGDYGFGVDENTALLVEGTRAEVCGETGVVVVDLKHAVDGPGGGITGVRVSYLDHGDAYDLGRHRALPAPEKKRTRVTGSSFRVPATVRRCAFGSYTLHDLMLRLAGADPSRYARDGVSSWPEQGEEAWRVEVERVPRVSRALRSVRDGKTRSTLINFLLHLRPEDRAGLGPGYAPLHPHLHQTSRSQLVLLGNSPLEWGRDYVEMLKPHLKPPVGVIAAASASPDEVVREYCTWLRGLGLEAEDLALDERTIARRNRDPRFPSRVRRLGTVLIAGGNQRRLTQTLTYRGDLTAVLKCLFQAFESDTNLVAVGGAAAAFGPRMIADGDSFAALRYGASDDAGTEGMVMEQGLGLFEGGIVDQNFMRRGRLGRLVVACVEEGIRYGFGLCEESGLVMTGTDSRAVAFGRDGFVVVDVNGAERSVASDAFSARGVELRMVRPGDAFDVVHGAADLGVDGAAAAVESMVKQLARQCGAALHGEHAAPRDAWLNLAFRKGPPARLDVESRRVRY